MSILNLFKPKWQHSDPRIRIEAVTTLNDNIELLGRIVLEDSDCEVRQAALALISDSSNLQPLLAQTSSDEIQLAIKVRINAILLEKILTSSDQSTQLDILEQVESQDLLESIVQQVSSSEVRLQAIKKIQDQDVLARIVTLNCGKLPSLAAIEKINDESLLKIAVKRASNRSARQLAQKKLEILTCDSCKPSEEQILLQELQKLVHQAQGLCLESNIAKAWQQMQHIHDRWQTLSPSTHILTEKLDSVRSELEERYQKFQKNKAKTDERAEKISAGKKRLGQIISEIDQLITNPSIKSREQFDSLKSEWQEIAMTLGDKFVGVLQIEFEKVCDGFTRIRCVIDQELDQENNFLSLLQQTKKLLIAGKLDKTAINITQLNRDFERWQPAYVDNQGVYVSLAEIALNHEQVVRGNEEELEKQLVINLEARLSVLDRLKGLIDKKDRISAESKVKELSEEWAKPVKLPAGSENLDTQFQELYNLFFEHQREFYKEKDWQRWQNKNLKEQIIEQATTLDNENNLHLVFKQIKEMQTRWQEIGPAPGKLENGLYKQFKETTDRNFKRCKLFFKKLDEEAALNLQKKQELCRLAAERQDSNEWQKTTAYLKDLQSQWKNIGRAPNTQENEVYTLFRKACDCFFSHRQAHYEELDRQREDNFQQKEELCEQVEKIVEAPQETDHLRIKKLQKQWKEIGPIPREHQDPWSRFRKACDNFYEWLDSLKPENLLKKEELCQQLEEVTTGISPKSNLQVVTKKIISLQNKWKEIGPVPKEDQDSIWQRFHGPCDDFFTKRRQHFEKIDQHRPENQKIKEEILAEIKILVNNNDRQSVKKIIALQEQWRKVGPATRDQEGGLQKHFKEICNNFFQDRREAFEELDLIRRENLKMKEALCLRLEIAAGITPKQQCAITKGKKQGLSLAEQLKVAFESNFVMAGDDKNRTRRKTEEAATIKDEWQKIGQVPTEHEYAVKKRYKAALSALNGKKKQKREKSNPTNTAP